MSRRKIKRYVPMRVDEHSWIVGLCAVEGDDTPTVVTERGARDWAASLNSIEDLRGVLDGVKADSRRGWFEVDPTPRPWRGLTRKQATRAGFWDGVRSVFTFGRHQ